MPNYLYNGVDLPDYSVSMGAPYNHAMICGPWSDGSYSLYLSEYEWYASGTSIEGFDTEIKTAKPGSSEWTFSHYTDFEKYDITTSTLGVFWSSYDIVDKTTGEVWFPASDPVPVAASTLDPESMTMGWLMGRKVAALRRNVRTIWRGQILLTEEHAAAMAYGTYATELLGTAIIEPGKTYALTVNGTVTVLTAEEFVFGKYEHGYLGNKWLYLGIWDPGGDESPGMDYCFSSCVKDGALVKNEFGARFPGTYNIRIEEVT